MDFLDYLVDGMDEEKVPQKVRGCSNAQIDQLIGDLKTILKNFEKGEEAFFYKLYLLKAHPLKQGRVGINADDCKGRAVDLLKIAVEEMRRRM
jgi:hypothetical protein